MISVGIDVSKGKSTVCMLRPDGELVASPFELLHTQECILGLIERISSFGSEARVVLEATGNYHYPVIKQLMAHGIFVSCINSLRMQKFCSQDIRRGKTDRIDAVKIAQYGILYWSELQPSLAEKDTYAELRNYSRQYYQYNRLSINARLSLGNLLDRAMPGIKTLLSDSKGKLSGFVNRYWHFDTITTMGEAEFVSDYCEWAQKEGYYKNEQKAKQIFKLAQNGIPTLPNTEATKTLVLEAVRISLEIKKSRDTILSHMQHLASTLPEYPVVIAMNGVGCTLAPRLIAEIGAIGLFHSKNALIAYAGIDTPPYQSGGYIATNRSISKRGNKYLRKTGFEIVQSVVRAKPSDDNAVYQFVMKKRAEGKSKKASIIAGLNKFLKIYYARVSELYSEAQEPSVNA